MGKKTHSRRTKIVRRWLRGLLVSFLLALSLAIATYFAVQHRPGFYQEQLRNPQMSDAATARQFEQAMANVHNAMRNEGDWQVSIADDELNSWLAIRQAKQLPELLPKELNEPRIKIENQMMRMACQSNWQGFEVILSLDLEVFLTEEFNTVGVKFSRLRCGAIPLPTNQITSQISAAVTQAGMKIRWTQEAGKPLALISIPERWDEADTSTLILKSVQVRPGRLDFSGTTNASDSD